MKSRHVKILVTVAVVLTGGILLAYSSMSEAAYYVHVNDLLAKPDKWEGKSLNVHGFAVPGSIKERIQDQRTTRNFQLEYCGKVVSVSHGGTAPDTFKDLAETVVTGTLVKEGDAWAIHAVEGERGISAKCPSKYDGQPRELKCPDGSLIH